jgi:hypothetical protein
MRLEHHSSNQTFRWCRCPPIMFLTVVVVFTQAARVMLPMMFNDGVLGSET